MSPRLNALIACVFLLGLAHATSQLTATERAQYLEEVQIGTMPAWLVLPVPAPTDRFGPPDPPSPRPPVVIVAHGFSASRQAMSWLVRSLARNGFAVLAGDFRGHGQNTAPFNRLELSADIDRLIAYAKSRPEVDGTRIALVGHSMGAFAVYSYALEHRNVDAVIPVSGSAAGGDRTRPRNALLIVASGDPERIRTASRDAMTRLTAGQWPANPSAAGDLAGGTARDLVEIPGHDHVTILFSDVAARRIVEWLRGTWDLEAKPFVPTPGSVTRDGLVAVASGLLLFFPLVGFLGAGILRVRPAPGAPRPGAIWMAAAATIVAGVALFAGTPLSFLPFAAGNQLQSFYLVAGVVYWLWVRRQPRAQASDWSDRLRAVALGIAAFALVYCTFGLAASRVFFNLMMSGQRTFWFIVTAPLFLPLGLGLETALRPPGGMRATARSLAAKALLVFGMVIAINVFGTLPPVIGLMVPSLLIVLPIVEALAAALYTVSGNVVASGVLTALMLAWLPAAIFPIM
ncbi:MAG TPA: alpha/beta fold hydrolase [Candidatus Kryptonia bacterium]|nr:alpha/beta fold hydrolase [Candidatus Kryptonia bacterium]